MLKYILIAAVLASVLFCIWKQARFIRFGKNKISDDSMRIKPACRTPAKSIQITEKVLTAAVRVLAGMALAILLAGSWAVTAFLDRSEHLYILPDGCIKHLIVFAAATAFFICAKRLKCPGRLKGRLKFERPFRFLIAMALITAVFVIFMQVSPVSDQASVSSVAAEILNGNLSSLSVGEYMDRYPDQKGIVVIFALIYSVAGKKNYLVIELLNVLAVMAVCVFIFYLTP